MEQTDYWLSPTAENYDSYYQSYRIVGSEMEENLGKVLVREQDNEYVIIIEREDIGQKKFDSTDEEETVSEIVKVAASNLYYS